MLGMRHVYHVSPFASTPHRSSPGYAHPPPSPWSYEGFRKPENEKSYTIELQTILGALDALEVSDPQEFICRDVQGLCDAPQVIRAEIVPLATLHTL